MPQPGVVAHRGASAHEPEHTLAAYELALRGGADAVECDVRLTVDGQLVCVHDRRVDRTSTGRGVVSAMTLERMAALDYSGALVTLPRLLELLASYPTASYPTAPKLFCETKHPVRYGGLVEAKVVAALHRFGLAAPPDPAAAAVVMMSFSPAAVWRVRRAAPRLPTVLLGQAAAALARTPGATAVGPGLRMLRDDPDLVARAARAGRDTYTWTVDTPADAAFCRDLGVRWIATNHPLAMRGWLGTPRA